MTRRDALRIAARLAGLARRAAGRARDRPRGRRLHLEPRLARAQGPLAALRLGLQLVRPDRPRRLPGAATAAGSTRSSRSGRCCCTGPGRTGTIVVGGALAWAASLAAFFGVSNGLPRSPLRSALALACWPGSFALALAYPDALALAAAAWAAAFALRGKPLAAGALGAVAALARPNGVLIALPLAWLARGKGPRGWLGAALPVAAAAGVEAYFWARSDRATAFFDAQKLWGRDGPRNLGHWADHVGGVLQRHGAR